MTRRPFRVVVRAPDRDRLWGTYATRAQADEIAAGLRAGGEQATVRTFKRDEKKR